MDVKYRSEVGKTPAVDRPAPQHPLIDSPRAWVAAVGVAVANGIGFGTAYTFGTFFDAMATEFGTGSGATAVIFGCTLLFFFGLGVIAGPVFDRVGPRPMLITGGTLFVGGLLATAQVDQLWLGVLTYGAGVGIGCGLYVSPLTALIGGLFARRRTMALALAAVGNGVGTLVLSPLAEWIIAREGWRQAYVTIAVIAAVGLALAAIALVDPPGRSSRAAGFDAAASTARRAVGDPGFRSLFYSATLMSVGLFVAFAFVVPFAIDDGITSAGASRLVGLIGLSSVLGRLGLMMVAARMGPVRLMQLTLILQPLAYVIWLLAGGRYAALVAFAVVLGVAYGGFVAVSPEALIYLVGTAGIGTTMGLMFLSFGVGGLIGPPAAGFLADGSGSNVVPILVVIALLAAALAASMPMGRAERHPAG
jgi:predicted MFS family arabinose efflux permease